MIKQMILYLRTWQQTQQTQQTQKNTMFSNASPGTLSVGGIVQAFVPVRATTESKYGGNRLLDEKVIRIIQDFDKIIRFCETP